MTVTEYIKSNWEQTYRSPDDVVHGIVRLPHGFTVPCAKVGFTDFYYWDTYFTNIGLLLSGRADRAESNLDNMKCLVDNLGYIPNANHILDRSQPPFFTRGVYELYKYKNDANVITKYIDSIMRELDFWEYSRKTDCGLNAYGCHTQNRRSLLDQGRALADRVGTEYKSEAELERLSKNFLAIAESGWDFNYRFRTDDTDFGADEFAHIDLNCLLYDAEKKTAEMLSVIGNSDMAKHYADKAAARKALITEKMRNPADGVYLDYNFKNNTFGRIYSCASFYAFALEISDDANAAKALLARLEFPHGISSCEKRPGDRYLQWDYPAMWPSNAYMAYNAMKAVGAVDDAKRIAEKYIDTADRLFEKTGSLWEKYDSETGDVSVSREYETPSMLGWTAGVYLFFKDQLK